MKHYYSNPVALILKAGLYYRKFVRAVNLSADELYAYQFKCVFENLSYAYQHVPYYKETFSSCGFQPGDFKELSNLKDLPYLTKDVLRSEDPVRFLSDEADRLNVAYLKTSGSTGTPLQFACDLNARAAKYAITMMAFREAGYRLGDGQFILKNCFYADKAFAYSRLTNRIAMHAYMNSKENCKACDVVLRRHRVKHILAHPHALLEFGHSISSPRDTFKDLRGISSLSEPLTPGLRGQIEACFGSRVYDYYSNMESSLVGYETQKQGYLLGEQFSYNEIIPDGTDPMSGEIVSTTFFSKAMPLIRYRNADIVKLRRPGSEEGAFRRIVEVCGRTSDAVLLPDGNRVRIFHLMHSRMDNIQTYQFVQDAQRHLFVDVVPIEVGRHIHEYDIVREMKMYVGEDVAVDIRIVAELRKTKAGKTPRIISCI